MAYVGTYNRLRLPITASAREVIAAGRLKLKPAARRDPGAREARKAFYRELLEAHESARELAHYWSL